MMSYRFARRSFLSGIGGALGLRVMLQTMEATAQGMKSPPRFLLTHWPVGTIKYNFVPQGSGTNFTFSRILKPFETAGLKDDMIILYGLDANAIPGPGGGHEKGTPLATTGAATPGTRDGEPETDDAFAGGPSFDQIFLKNVPDLVRPGIGYANAICDSRVDLLEVSTQCLSYGYAKQSVAQILPSKGTGSENIPLLPQLSPLQLYLSLFSSFSADPTGGNTEALKRALIERKSVLDFSLRELDRLKKLAPASEADKIQIHADAIRKIEMDLTSKIAGGVIMPTGCTPPAQPDAASVGKADGKIQRHDYGIGRDSATASDEMVHEAVGKLHMGIITAAFQCDIIRVATFQWSPGTNHVAFQGKYPGEASTIYMHHPVSHRIGTESYCLDASTVPSSGTNKNDIEFLTNIQTWYNEKMAGLLSNMKTATDAYGGSLLDYTIVPYVTEVAQTVHTRYPLPAMIFGGKKLGMIGGQYQNFESTHRPHNDLWLTIAQAYFPNQAPTDALKAEIFATQKKYTGPIPGLWAKPA
jgi:hypothetical protein